MKAPPARVVPIWEVRHPAGVSTSVRTRMPAIRGETTPVTGGFLSVSVAGGTVMVTDGATTARAT